MAPDACAFAQTYSWNEYNDRTKNGHIPKFACPHVNFAYCTVRKMLHSIMVQEEEGMCGKTDQKMANPKCEQATTDQKQNLLINSINRACEYSFHGALAVPVFLTGELFPYSVWPESLSSIQNPLVCECQVIGGTPSNGCCMLFKRRQVPTPLSCSVFNSPTSPERAHTSC